MRFSRNGGDDGSAAAALGELSEQEAGIGSGVMLALNKTGGPLGAAILGSVLSDTYLARLDVSQLPAPAADAARRSVFANVAVAQRTGSSTLMHSVQAAFVDGMDRALVVSAAVAIAGAVVALVFLPREQAGRARDAGREPGPEGAELVGLR